MSFAAASVAVLTLYILTLAPDVTLGFGGIFAVGGMYAGVAHPPGYPLATLWHWIFIRLLPFGPVAWRVAVSSAVAGALACGVIALMVSSGGRRLAQPTSSGWNSRIRIAAGFAAGMVFGATSTFWQRAIIADVWTLSVLMICIGLCLLMRWACNPDHRRYLYSAAFAYGLTLTNSQIQLALAPAIPFLVWAGSRHIARDLFLAASLVLTCILCGVFSGLLAQLGIEAGLGQRHSKFLIALGAVMAGCGIGLSLVTRRVFSEWKHVLAMTALFLVGLAFYFYVPIASMTNPPLNWGYARTGPGFYHVITRGQYERIRPTESADQFARQGRVYAVVTAKQFGWHCLAFALIPFFLLGRMGNRERAWMLGMLAAYLCLAFLTLAVLNPAVDRQSLDLNSVFFSASYVVLALWLGYGLVFMGSLLMKPVAPTEA